MKTSETNPIEPEVILPHEWPAHEESKALARQPDPYGIFVMCFEVLGIRVFIVFTM